MKLRKQQLLPGATIFLIVVLGTLLLLGRSGDEKTVIANDLQWRVGSAQEYDVLVNSSFEMTMPGASSGQSMDVKLDGVLEFRTLEVNPTEVLVGMRLSSMEIMIAGVTDAAVNRALTLPFRVRIAANGLLRSFEFPAALAAEHREVIENLVRMFQLVVGDGDAWVVQESNASGNYEAAYTRNSPSSLLKKKQRYIGSTAAMAATVPEVVSEETIRIDVNNDWITAMTLEETVSSKDLSGPSVVVNNHASLKLRDQSAAVVADVWNFVSSAAPVMASKQVPATVPAISREEAERRLRTEVTALDAAAEGRSIFIHRLRDLLLVDGKFSFVLLDLMKTQQLSDRTRADLYLAFELAGSPEAQGALTSVFTDPGWSREDSMRAIVALGGVANPTESTLEALWTTAHSTGGDRDDLPGTAALALGSLGRSMSVAGDASYLSLQADLLDGATSAADTHQRAVFLHAIGNTGDSDPLIRSNIVHFLNDSAPEVRSAAAKTLGRLGASQVSDKLLQSFKQEKNDVVRGSITEALSTWEDPTLPAIVSIRSAIKNERDEIVRYNMAIFLGKSMEAFPENRIVLEQLLGVEQSKRIRQQVAEMLYATR